MESFLAKIRDRNPWNEPDLALIVELLSASEQGTVTKSMAVYRTATPHDFPIKVVVWQTGSVTLCLSFYLTIAEVAEIATAFTTVLSSPMQHAWLTHQFEPDSDGSEHDWRNQQLMRIEVGKNKGEEILRIVFHLEVFGEYSLTDYLFEFFDSPEHIGGFLTALQAAIEPTNQ